MKLHYAEVLNPRKVCALAQYLDSPIEYVRVDLVKGAHRTGAFRALNPNAKVPVLEHGDAVLWEADAILCYLAMHAGSDLWPHSIEQVEVIRWLSWNQVHFQRFGGVFFFERVVKPMFGIGVPDEQAVAEAAKPFKRSARVLDAHLANRAYLLGDRLSIADFSVAAVLSYSVQAQLPVGDCPAILRWHDRLQSIKGWTEPFPARSPASDT